MYGRCVAASGYALQGKQLIASDRADVNRVWDAIYQRPQRIFSVVLSLATKGHASSSASYRFGYCSCRRQNPANARTRLRLPSCPLSFSALPVSMLPIQTGAQTTSSV